MKKAEYNNEYIVVIGMNKAIKIRFNDDENKYEIDDDFARYYKDKYYDNYEGKYNIN